MIDDNKTLFKLPEIKTEETELDDFFEDFETFDKEIVDKKIIKTDDKISIDDAKELYAWCIRVEHALKRLLLKLFGEILKLDHIEIYNHKIKNKNTISNNISKTYVKHSMTKKLKKNCSKCSQILNNGILYADFGLLYELFNNIEWDNFISNFNKNFISNILNVKELRNFVFHLRSEIVNWREVHKKIPIVKLPKTQAHHDKIDWLKGLEVEMNSILKDCNNLRDEIRKIKKQAK